MKNDQVEVFAMSSNVAVLNLLQVGGGPSENPGDYLKPISIIKKRGIQEIPIILSDQELFGHNKYLMSIVKIRQWHWDLLIDDSVPVINQIVYTFNRQDMNVLNMMTNEVWQWKSHTYK